VHLYAERGSPKYEKAALRWLERYLSEGSPRLEHFAEIAANLASCLPIEERELEAGGGTRYPRPSVAYPGTTEGSALQRPEDGVHSVLLREGPLPR